MRAYRLTLLLLLLFIAPLSGCKSTSSPSATSFPEATVPVPRTKEFPWMSVSRWYQMHSEDVAIASTANVELLFIGDSITESWGWGEGRDQVYQRYFGDYHAANFAIGGDMTQNLLWRLRHNLKGQLDPTAVVLMIGVNNFLHEQHAPQAVAAGVTQIAEQVQQNYPNAKLLIIGVLPFHQNADNPSRQTVTETNRLIAELDDQTRVFYINVNDSFLDDQSNIPQVLMDDFIHPSAAGLEIVAQHVAPVIQPWIAEQRSRFMHIDAADPRIQVMGRAVKRDDEHLQFGYPGVTLRLKTQAESVSMRARSDNGNSFVNVQIDDGAPQAIRIPAQAEAIELLRTTDGKEHIITIQNRSETWHGTTTVESFTLEGGGLLPLPPLPERKLLFIGDSITCGDAVDRPLPKNGAECKKDNSWWNAQHTFGMLLGDELNAQVQLICYGGRGLIRSWDGRTNQMNAPQFYDYALATDNNPVKWDHSQYSADLAVIALGTNDFSASAGALPTEQEYTSAYNQLIKNIRRNHDDIQIIITDSPILADGDVKRKTVLQQYLRKIAAANTNVTFVPAKHYPGDQCDFHPNSQQHKAIAGDLLPEIKTIMQWAD